MPASHILRRRERASGPGAHLRHLLKTMEPSVSSLSIGDHRIPLYAAEFWTSRQRQALSIHEVSYRACFKAQLPQFFIERLTTPGDTVYDPFSGRGTTIVQAGISERHIIGNDVNPLSTILSKPRFFIPSLDDVRTRLASIAPTRRRSRRRDLSMFYHPQTESEIFSLRAYLASRKRDRSEDEIDAWIRMVATNRLSGHSRGFFSVYSLPPNQAVTPDRQILINKKLKQTPEYRDTRALIIRKSKSLLRDLSPTEISTLRTVGRRGMFLNSDARRTRAIPTESVQLTVTSPPFLDVVNYSTDNWLRCWFNEIDDREIAAGITHTRNVTEWCDVMRHVLWELFRVTRSGGWVVFEVGEVRKKSVRLEEHVIPLGISEGFECAGVLINSQVFTKTSNIWGITNNTGGTNTNRMVVFQKP